MLCRYSLCLALSFCNDTSDQNLLTLLMVCGQVSVSANQQQQAESNQTGYPKKELGSYTAVQNVICTVCLMAVPGAAKATGDGQ